MKKLVMLLVILMAIPGAAFGMQMLNDSKLDNVTGQSGVSIVFDDIQMFINIDRMAYIDTDGFNSTSFYGTGNVTGGAGAIAIDNFQMDTLNINAIVKGSLSGGTWDLVSSTAGSIPLQFDYASTAALYNLNSFGSAVKGLENYTPWNTLRGGDSATNFCAKALTIDVTDDLPVTTEAIQANMPALAASSLTIGGVMIGLPTAEINISDLVIVPTFIDAAATTTAYNNGSNYGTFLVQGMNMAILNGWLEIAPNK